jgi:hypothetical protein
MDYNLRIGPNLFGSGWSPVNGCCEHRNKASSSVVARIGALPLSEANLTAPSLCSSVVLVKVSHRNVRRSSRLKPSFPNKYVCRAVSIQFCSLMLLWVDCAHLPKQMIQFFIPSVCIKFPYLVPFHIVILSTTVCVATYSLLYIVEIYLLYLLAYM